MTIEHKRVSFDVENVGEEGTITGYGSVFGIVDGGNDVVLPGAFKKSLAARNGKPIPMLWNHIDSFPIGKWTQIEEDDRGLKLSGRFTMKSAKAQEIHALATDGVISGLSIGYRTVDAEKDPTTGVRRLKELDLWEVSAVTFPMLEDAQIDNVKHEGSISLDDFLSLTDRDQERILTKRDARQLSRSAAIALMRDGIPALKAKRDAGDKTAAHEVLLNSILNDIRAFKGVQK